MGTVTMYHNHIQIQEIKTMQKQQVNNKEKFLIF